ncbi:hypothetical protein HDIA_4337 [Hartmannibacter diazotrophicus]|uniref:DUF1761 domain-containing protein n=1 Tax=Hartmannibacter diazotrophicus TaxID=1482074 RepID=A0A2C9DCM2_9HYPH|nr:DUF1761 domain-containing protein [Hartmannibacter diazotrophicus]SON57878.1 hypothetical protein HDIA_4337 [Hartmannibacter diazotrophicus]
MDFTGISYLAVVLAAVAGFAVGALWYGLLFGRAWMTALGKSREDLGGGARPFVTSIIANLVMAWLLAGLIGHIGPVDPVSGLITAFFVWLAFIATTMTVNYAFQGARPALLLIDAGHWLAVLLVMGLVIGLVGA